MEGEGNGPGSLLNDFLNGNEGEKGAEDSALAIDKLALNKSVDSIVDHFHEILLGGSQSKENNGIPETKSPSGAAILLKMILNEIENQPTIPPKFPSSRDPLWEYKPPIMNRKSPTPPTLPPNKPKIRLMKMNLEDRQAPTRPIRSSVSMTASRPNSETMKAACNKCISGPHNQCSTPAPKILRSCLKKQSSQSLNASIGIHVGFSAARAKSMIEFKDNDESTSELKCIRLGKKNSVRFIDEMKHECGVNATIEPINNKKAILPYTDHEIDSATESVTTLYHTITSGFEFLDEFFFSQLPQVPPIALFRKLAVAKDY